MKIDEAIKIIADPLEYELKTYIEASEMAIKALEAQRWIPVSERLPTEKDANNSLEVLVWDYSNCWHDLLGYGSVEDNDHITHWMPLPEPPEMTREEAGHWDGIAHLT